MTKRDPINAVEIEMSGTRGGRRFGVRIGERVVKEMLQHCVQAGMDETGGILLGQYTAVLDCAIVSRVTGPTKDSKAGRTWFHRGVEGLQRLIDKLWRSGEAYYVGEWHFHPFAPADPSPVDFATLRSISRSAGYNCPEPVLLIVGGDPRGLWWASALVYTRGGSEVPLAEGA